MGEGRESEKGKTGGRKTRAGVLLAPDCFRGFLTHSYHRAVITNFFDQAHSTLAVGAVLQFIYICKSLYMFRVISPPIIRSSYH